MVTDECITFSLWEKKTLLCSIITHNVLILNRLDEISFKIICKFLGIDLDFEFFALQKKHRLK